MDEPIVVGIDIGTTKVCTLVGRVEGERSLRIIGVGIEPSQGIRKGNITDLAAASQSIARSIEKAQRSSGLEITAALISLAGSHVSSVNSRGVVGISGRAIDYEDVARALEERGLLLAALGPVGRAAHDVFMRIREAKILGGNVPQHGSDESHTYSPICHLVAACCVVPLSGGSCAFG